MDSTIESPHASHAPASYSGAQMRPARSRDQRRLLATLTSAFIGDPPVRWLYPDPADYLEHFPAFANAFGGGALTQGTAWQIQDYAGCALWLPPDTGPDEQALIALLEKSIPAARRDEAFALLAALGAAHPTEPHWYLPLIGVDVTCQGRGLGATLLRATLAVCDRDGLPAYLEATSPRNIPLYERFGFQRREPLCVGTCPPITPMWREPE